MASLGKIVLMLALGAVFVHLGAITFLATGSRDTRPPFLP
jgi:hypothetical protein